MPALPPDAVARDEAAVAGGDCPIMRDAEPLALASWRRRPAIRPPISSGCSNASRRFARRLCARPAAGARADPEGGRPVTEAMYDAGYRRASRSMRRARRGWDDALGLARRRPGETIRYAMVDTPRPMLVAATHKGVCRLSFDEAARRWKRAFPHADLVEGGDGVRCFAGDVIAAVEKPGDSRHIPLDVQGTAFQEAVWQELRKIPPGETRSYADIAAAVGKPRRSPRGGYRQRREQCRRADSLPPGDPHGRQPWRICLWAGDQAGDCSTRNARKAG